MTAATVRRMLSGFRRRVPDAATLTARAATLEHEGRLLDAIDALSEANRLSPDADVESRLVRLRRAAFPALDRSPRPLPPAPAADAAPVDELEWIAPSALSAASLRAGIRRQGFVWVRGLVPPALVIRLRDAIDRAFEAFDLTQAGTAATPDTRAWYEPLDDLLSPAFARQWRREANAVLTADSPRALFTLLEVVASVGIGRLLADFFGERPALAAEKCTLFRVDASDWRMRVADWHQDGAFLGDGIRTLNCWFALSPCGRDAPGMDVVPRRIERVLPVGGEKCHFDWTLSPVTVARELPGAPVCRPQFQEGDVLLFDELAIHRTAADEGMPNVRYAIESWFFAPSAYPVGRSTPLVV